MFSKRYKAIIMRSFLIVTVLVMMVGEGLSGSVLAASGDTTLISLGSLPSPLAGNNSSYRASISGDGRYVAFYSLATNLVSGDTNGKQDIFIFDRQAEQMERVSVDSSGIQANGNSYAPTISANGRYVAFYSDASNLVSGDTNGGRDVFLRDLQTGLTQRLSVVSSGAGDSGYVPPGISADGRYVAFGSASNGMVSEDMNGMDDIFVVDRQTGLTERVSVAPGGSEANGPSFTSSLSADGRYVAFGSTASNLVGDDTNGMFDLFVFDRQTGLTDRVSVGLSGIESNGFSDYPVLSADGRYVAFNSDATNLVSDDTNNQSDVFVYDRLTSLTERVSISSSGLETNYNSYAASISFDGRYIAFASYAGNLVGNDANSAWDVFVHDRQTDTTERVSVDSNGVEGNSGSDRPVISGDGHYVAFDSGASNLAISDLNYVSDIFVHNRQTNETKAVSSGPVGMGANQGSYDPSVSADGRYVSFVSTASNLVSGDTNGKPDVFVRDRQTGSIERASVGPNVTQANEGTYSPAISADGRYVAFDSLATNLVSNDANPSWDVFVHDRQTGVTELVSVNSSEVQANNGSQLPAISADGRYVTFESYSTNLVAGDTGVRDVFLRDRQAGLTERISVAPGGVLANNSSESPSISADGRYVAFRSRASNLVSGDTNSTEDIFVFDRQTGTMHRVSINSNGMQPNNTSDLPLISADGRYVAFRSRASNLVPDDTNGMEDIFLHDCQTGITERVSVDSNGVGANSSSTSPTLSSDGRFVAFVSGASNLVSGDTNNGQDVFVHDFQTRLTSRVSINSNGVEGNGNSSSPALTGNGQFIIFSSGASNLVNGDDNFSNDIFLHETNFVSSPKTIYVNLNASGAQNGTSWADAYIDLQSALFAAFSGDQIWVAAGTYKPTPGTDRTMSFTLRSGVAIYGGFAGTETMLAQRDVNANVTTLSGDIGLVGNTSDNSYHVVIGSNTDLSAILDGFVITAGKTKDDFGTSPEYMGGGMYSVGGSPSLSNLIFRANAGRIGNAMFNSNSSPTLLNVTFVDNPWFAGSVAGAMVNDLGSNPTLTNVAFTNNSGWQGGALYNARQSNPSLVNVSFESNSSSDRGGAIYNYSSHPTLTNVTFHANSATQGGAIFNDHSNPTLVNVTFAGNSASGQSGGAINNFASDPTLTHVTFSQNSASEGGAISNDNNSHTTITASILYGDSGGEISNNGGTITASYSIVQGGYPGTGNLDLDPGLGPLQANGGFTQTMALGLESSAVNAADDAHCPSTDQRGVARPQGSHCDMGAYENDDNVSVSAGGIFVDSYHVIQNQNKSASYSGVDNGPLRIQTIDGTKLVTSERVAYSPDGGSTWTSYSELMGMPVNQLTTSYTFPWYNNTDLNTQLRFGNVGASSTTVTVTVGGQIKGVYSLLPNQSKRVNYLGLNAGPVKVTSSGNVPIVASERVAYHDSLAWTSFSELMGLPSSKLTTSYTFPWYNNVDLNSQLRFGNVGAASTTVSVTVAGQLKGSYLLKPNESTRVSYSGLNAGPVKVTSSGGVPIIASLRVAYFDSVLHKWTDFSEMMGMPTNALSTNYSFPTYNNLDLNTQLRFGNVGTSPTTVTVTIGGVLRGTYMLGPNASQRVSYLIHDGPVVIQSSGNVPIIASERVAYFNPSLSQWTSFAEMMGLPKEQLTTSYLFPWYNNADLDTQLRFGVP